MLLKRRILSAFVIFAAVVAACTYTETVESDGSAPVARFNSLDDSVVTGGCFYYQTDDHHNDVAWNNPSCGDLSDFANQTFYGAVLRDSLWSVAYAPVIEDDTFRLVYQVRAQYHYLDSLGNYDASLTTYAVVGAEFADTTACGTSSICPRAFPAVSFSSILPAGAVAVEFLGMPGICPRGINHPLVCAETMPFEFHDEPRLCVQNDALPSAKPCGPSGDRMFLSSTPYVAPEPPTGNWCAISKGGDYNCELLCGSGNSMCMFYDEDPPPPAVPQQGCVCF